jgi:predicted enzyme related to lactoylglutathione lyase
VKIGPIETVTILTNNLDKSATMYSSAFGWQIKKGEYLLAADQAINWGARNLIGSKTLEVGGINGAVRLIESINSKTTEPLKTYGWTALEICVNDVNKYVAQAVGAGFRVLNEAVPLAGSDKPLPLIAAQLAGINGEVVYITQILSEVPNFELPDVSKESGSIFICVLGASNLEKSREVIESNFEVRRASDRQVAIKVLNRVYEKDFTTMYRLSTLQLAGRNAIEIDQMPVEAMYREVPLENLPAGISIVSVVANVSEPRIIQLPDNALLELIPNKN